MMFRLYSLHTTLWVLLVALFAFFAGCSDDDSSIEFKELPYFSVLNTKTGDLAQLIKFILFYIK